MLKKTVLVLAGLAVCVATSLVAIPSASALNGLAIRSTTTFVVDPDSESIRVDATYSVTNVTADRRRNGRITQYYYDGLSIPIPVEAVDIAAVRSDGRTLRINIDEESPDNYTVFGDVSFGRNVFYRSTTTFTVSYRLPSAQVRSDESGVRVNPAYAVFGAYGIGDPNAVTVQVKVPADFEVTVEGATTVEWTEQDGIKTFEVADIAEPEEFYLFVVARNDDALERRSVDIGNDRTVQILHWPGDTEWADFVESELETGFVALQELIGQPFEDENLEIIQSVDPTLQGYAGWYIPDDEVIEVSEDLDRALILHELSHAWFNDDLFVDRWITEGLAEEYSARSLAVVGEDIEWPRAPGGRKGVRQPLNEWNTFVPEDERQATEEYGYNASWYVMRRLGDEIGMEAMSEIIDAVADDEISYLGDGEPEGMHDFVNDWRRFLDLAQERHESDEIEDLYRNYVLAPWQETMLDRRAELRTRYEELENVGSGWAPPLGLRISMSTWQYADLETSFDVADTTLNARDEVVAMSEPLGLALPDELEESYEAAVADEELSTLAEGLDEYESTAEMIAKADAEMNANRDPIERIGLLGTDYSPWYQQARSNFELGEPDAAARYAEDVIAGFEAASDRGADRAMAAGAVIFAIAVLGGVWIKRRRRSMDSEDEAASPFAENETSPSAESVPSSENRQRAAESGVDHTIGSEPAQGLPDEEAARVQGRSVFP